jgi:tetratricopeptide (TPR) repeat protein
MSRIARLLPIVLILFLIPWRAAPEPAGKLILPASTSSILDHIYAGRPDLALPEVHQLEQQEPDNPLGYLLEAEAEWWRIWCVSAEYKYGMTMARHHEKMPSDQPYLELTAKAYSLAEASLRQHNTGEMHLYAAMADGLTARLYALRSEYRASARAAVRARENFLMALELDPTLYDAYSGLGLYNYYVDTLSALAKALRFLMGIPGGTKEEGIRQLERGIQEGQISSSLARFYLALNLFNYDQKYEQALKLIIPMAEKYPGNPVFQLMRGDLNAKLGRKQLAEACYHAADSAADEVPEAECRAKMKQLVRQSLEALERR